MQRDMQGHQHSWGPQSNCDSVTQTRVLPPHPMPQSPCNIACPLRNLQSSSRIPPVLFKSRLQGSSRVLGTAQMQLWVQRLQHPNANTPGSGVHPSSLLHPDGTQQAPEAQEDPGACCNHGGEIQSGEGTGWSWLPARPLRRSCRCSGACGRPRLELCRFQHRGAFPALHRGHP